ncbi:MAG: hypothetical protein IKK50_02065 [Ruminiclostridium sp.]|nr:hypothetical protein [Ruminiclostridium sp.]
MARKFTYEDFERAANEAGLLGEFSSADLKLAQQDPDAGMSILNYKKDYHAATTDEARALANQGAEKVRTSFGEYSGGQDGSGFYVTPVSPNHFDYGSAPTYTSRYDGQIQDILGQITNREPFSYDADTDPLYSQYRKEYTREGKRATADALAEAAAASGGIPSSYASTAAGQAGNYYASKMTDKIPELEQLAFQKYMNEANLKYSDLAAVQSAEQSDFDKFLAELSQFNTDRSFAYGQLLDEIDSQTLERNEALDKAVLAATYGDYSFLNDMGINTDDISGITDWEKQFALAEAIADLTGDTSYLYKLLGNYNF